MDGLPYKSLPAMFCEVCARPDFPGWNAYADGTWRHYSGEELLVRLRAMFFAFKRRGIKKGSVVGIVAPPSPDWVLIDLAIQTCGGIVVPMFPNAAETSFVYIKDHAEITTLVLDSIDTLDEELRSCLPLFHQIFQISLGEFPENAEHLGSLLEEGKAVALNSGGQEEFNRAVAELPSEEVFSIIYTSGSTGLPKGVPLTHANIMAQFAPLEEVLHLAPGEKALSILPTAHIFERLVIFFYVHARLEVFFGGDPKQLAMRIREVEPVAMTVVPRLLERIFETFVKYANTSPFPKSLLLKLACRWAIIHPPGKRRSLSKLVYDRLVFRPFRKKFSDFRYLVSGGSALNKSIERFFMNAGLPVLEGYGMTECAPVVSINVNPEKIGSVGEPLSCVKVKIDRTDEILVKGPNVFKGYYKLEHENAKYFTKDGYFRTGDSGFFGKTGALYLTGRIKEMFKTSTGKYVSPTPIEEVLETLPVISFACVVANNRKFVSAVLFLSEENLRALFPLMGEEFSLEFAAGTRRVRDLVERHVRKVNKHLNHWEQVRRWTIVLAEPSSQNGLLTPTLKLCRREVERRFAKEIDEMYREEQPA